MIQSDAKVARANLLGKQWSSLDWKRQDDQCGFQLIPCAIRMDDSLVCRKAGEAAATIDLGSDRTAKIGGVLEAIIFCAVLDDDSLKCWGYNLYGQLGDGATIDRNTPVAVNFGKKS